MPPRLLSRLALTLALLVPVAAPLAAQDPAAPATTPPKPKLHKEADPNYWVSYFAAGQKLLERNPKKAADAFWWAARYNPASADALHARWVSLWLTEPGLLRSYLEGAKFATRDARAVRIDSVLVEALSIDPFVGRHMMRWLYNELDGNEWSSDPATQGFLYYSEGRYDKAIRELAIGLKDRKAPWWWLHYVRGLAFHGAGQYDSAAVELSQLAARMRTEEARHTRTLYETPALYEFGAGKAYLQARMLDSARAALQRALAEDMSLYAAHGALAEVALLQGRNDEAVEERRIATELRPASGALLADYGTTLLRVGRNFEAVEVLRKALVLEPYYAGAYYNLGLALERSGSRADAVAVYREFLARAPRTLLEQIAYAEDRVRGS